MLMQLFCQFEASSTGAADLGSPVVFMKPITKIIVHSIYNRKA